MKKRFFYFFITTVLVVLATKKLNAQTKICFREDWKEIPAEIPISQKHVNNSNLILNLYGPARDSIKKSHHENRVKKDPYYLWSGLCTNNWAVTLRYKQKHIDLSAYGKVKWRIKQTGFRKLHVVVKLSNGEWLVSEQSSGMSKRWKEYEFNIKEINWYSLDIDNVTEIVPVKNPDMSSILEIGFTDLMRGGKTKASSRIDWIEVYGELKEN